MNNNPSLFSFFPHLLPSSPPPPLSPSSFSSSSLDLQTTALAERQSAVYSLQRRLKTARQQLESKELHLGLLQKKVTSLEERLLTYSHHEGDWEAATVKVRGEMLVYICFPVFSPLVFLHFYPPLHHYGKGSIEQEFNCLPSSTGKLDI